MDIIKVILLTLVAQADAEYYISGEASTWKEAKVKCNMALPDLDLSQNGFNFNTSYNRSFDGDAWLGLFMKMTVFDYIGCVKLDGQTYSHIGQIISPGLCYTFCNGNEMIGLSFDKCICLKTLENYTNHETKCTTSCGSIGEGVACGGDGYMSVYLVNKNASAGSRSLPCLSLEQFDQEYFIWRRCSYYLRVMCEKELTVLDNYTWLGSMNECFKRGLLPKSYESLTEISSRTVPFWTGVISSDAIYNYKEWDKNLQDVQFAYVSANRSVYFTNKDEPKLVLCNSSPTYQNTTSSPLDTSSKQQTTKTLATIKTLQLDKHIVETANNEHSCNDKNTTTREGQNVGIIIGASLTSCVVVMAVVVFIILRRRGTLPSLPCSSEQDAMIDMVIGDSAPETVNSEQDNYTDLSRTEYINDSHTYDRLELNHNALGHQRNIETESSKIYYNDVMQKGPNDDGQQYLTFK